MHRTMRRGLPTAALALLAALALSCGIGCAIRPPYAARRSVACFTNAIWAQDEAGIWHLVRADWDFEPEMTPTDIRYQYREGKVLTPGFFEEILNRLEEDKK